MAGLYERDYSVLTDAEIAARDKLNESNNFGNRHIKKAMYFEYSKAVRHYESLFANNFMDIVDLRDLQKLTDQCNLFLENINREDATELEIKRLIQNNGMYHIPASLISHYWFGHHSTYVFKEFKLGTSYTADYVLVGRASGGHQFIFIECESLYGRITIEDGSFGDAITKGIRQVNDWKAYIAANYSSLYEEFRKHTSKSLPEEFSRFDPTRFNYIVIAGRRTNFNERTYRLARQSEHDTNVAILHYDNWFDAAIEVIGKNTY